MLAYLASPAFSATFITLNIGTGSGAWNDTSGVFTGTFNFSQVIVSDPSQFYSKTINLSPAVDDFSITFNSSTSAFTLQTGSSVESPFANLTTNSSVFTGTSGLSWNSSGSNTTTLSEQLNAGASLTGVNTAFLSDLKLPTNITTLAIAGGITGSFNSTSGLYTITSDTLTLTDTADVVPEPSTIFLLGAGLVIAAAIARRRQQVAARTESARA